MRRLRSLFEQREQGHAPSSLKQHAAELGLSYHFVQKRWKKFTAAKERGDEEGMRAVYEDRRGEHNRVFTPAQEQQLTAYVRDAYSVLTNDALRTAVTDFHSQLRRAEGRHHYTRSSPPQFKASTAFLKDFKRRQGLSYHTTKLVVEEREGKEKRDKWQEGFIFCSEVREAIMKYGPSLVLNADEVSHTDTPPLCLPSLVCLPQ